MGLKVKKKDYRKGLAIFISGLLLLITFSIPVQAHELVVEHEEIASIETLYELYEEETLAEKEYDAVYHEEEYGMEIQIEMALPTPATFAEVFVFEIAFRESIEDPITAIFYHVLEIENGNKTARTTFGEMRPGIYTVREISGSAQHVPLGETIITQEVNEVALPVTFSFTQSRIETSRPSFRLLERSRL